ncbi:cell envelope integrity protein CreD [Kordia sp. YSTF-M3]|uniref:Cell envelope integrity protein CreD n=1 Tax=Kordia aestuariivivens TaxID=2759037 RepID=A0ABR7QBW6_9FLAO|nr:cell envelope integrity protein CreD [Kordia aestuariivivens]MBC8756003.1 cell envelope integrity protein CreD [Kordia aestuariivivens]
METHQTEKNNGTKVANWFKTSITARMLMMGALILLLMIPLTLIQKLIKEREIRQQGVVSELNDKWGNSILLYGPILKVPYKTYEETVKYNEEMKETFKENRTIIKYAYFFPKKLDITADVKASSKKRNNFETAVFTSDIAASGTFETPDFSSKSIADADIVWEKATLLIKTTNLKGLKSEVKLNLNGNEYGFETNFNTINKSHTKLEELESSFIALADIPKTADRSFNFKLMYNGSKSIQFIPIGKVTNVQMKSDWKDPKHAGNFITQSERETENGGFEANWKLLNTNRSFSQQFFKVLPNLNQYAFGTEFIIPLDEYQKSERSAKYGFLVIGLTFLVFFLIQTLSKIPIHPFQYLMIGIALVMFYTLLISISEHSSFLKAYLIAGTAVIVMITLYSKSILKNWKFPVFIGTSLTALYGFIFVIIQMENYALLVGSIGLFLILGIVMFVSRKIDWGFDFTQNSKLTTHNS